MHIYVFICFYQGLKQTQSLLYVTQPVYVTTFLACHGSLWVGTNTGVIVNFPLPRLEGVPLVNGPAMVSYHAHYSPIRFLTSMEIHQQHDKILYSSTEDDAKSKLCYTHKSLHLHAVY